MPMIGKRLVLEILILVALVVTGALIYWPESLKPKKPNLYSEPERSFAGSSSF